MQFQKTSLDQNSFQQHDSPQPMKQYKPSRVHSMEDSVCNPDHHDNLMQRQQSDIAELIIIQQKLAMLPAVEVPVFDGDPLAYKSYSSI